MLNAMLILSLFVVIALLVAFKYLSLSPVLLVWLCPHCTALIVVSLVISLYILFSALLLLSSSNVIVLPTV